MSTPQQQRVTKLLSALFDYDQKHISTFSGAVRRANELRYPASLDREMNLNNIRFILDKREPLLAAIPQASEEMLSYMEKDLLSTLQYIGYTTANQSDNPLEYTDPDGRETSDAKTLLFAVKHLGAAIRIGEYKSGSSNISTNATRFQWEMPLNNEQKEGSSGNAFRHALWQATIRSEFGFDIALEAGNSHETGGTEFSDMMFVGKSFSSMGQADKVCDLLNNKLARILGAELKGKSMKEIAMAVLTYQHENGLFEAIQNEDGSYNVQRQTISQEAYDAGMARLAELDENGRE